MGGGSLMARGSSLGIAILFEAVESGGYMRSEEVVTIDEGARFEAAI